MGRDPTNEELLKQLKLMLESMTDQNGDFPKVYNS
jgi:hypothetical protein